MKKTFTAFTLAEVLITLGIIGIVAEMTIPTLVSSTQEKVAIVGLQKFNSTMQQAVMMWKVDIGCSDDAATCLASQNLPDGSITNFDQIAKFLKISDSTASSGNTDWLPADTLNYYGNSSAASFGKVSKTVHGNGAFLLQDGTIFSMDVDSNSFMITVDVNGKKPPNRVGKDTFPYLIGAIAGKDVSYFASYTNFAVTNTVGLCGLFNNTCEPNNYDPTASNGASPTAYVILNGKLPDFKALSQSVAGFKP